MMALVLVESISQLVSVLIRAMMMGSNRYGVLLLAGWCSGRRETTFH
jgi:hypothetical protein